MVRIVSEYDAETLQQIIDFHNEIKAKEFEDIEIQTDPQRKVSIPVAVKRLEAPNRLRPNEKGPLLRQNTSSTVINRYKLRGSGSGDMTPDANRIQKI